MHLALAPGVTIWRLAPADWSGLDWKVQTSNASKTKFKSWRTFRRGEQNLNNTMSRRFPRDIALMLSVPFSVVYDVYTFSYGQIESWCHLKSAKSHQFPNGSQLYTAFDSASVSSGSRRWPHRAVAASSNTMKTIYFQRNFLRPHVEDSWILSSSLQLTNCEQFKLIMRSTAAGNQLPVKSNTNSLSGIAGAFWHPFSWLDPLYMPPSLMRADATSVRCYNHLNSKCL